ncbi:MAG: hypothetical protein AABY43_04240 [Candidatus Omnitrophota bacterium]
MTLRILAKESFFISLLREACQRYCFFEQWIGLASKESWIRAKLKNISDKLKIYCRYSFLGRISEINNKDNSVVLDGSRFVSFWLGLYKKGKDSFLFYFKAGETAILAEDIKKGLYFQPIKTASVIMLAAILTNTIFIIFLHRQVSLTGWLMRAVFFFIAIAGLSCDIDWQGLEKTSFVLNKWLKK